MNDSSNIEDHSIEEQLQIANSLDSHAQELGWLSSSEFDEVAFAIIENPNTEVEILEGFVAKAQHNGTQYGNYNYDGVADSAVEELKNRS